MQLHAEFLRDVLAGLSASPKTLPCKYFYDERGSALFDEITTLDEYYPTRCELAILRDHAAEIAAAVGPGAVLVEYGSGSSVKTRVLLDALPCPAAYVPVDISSEHLMQSAGHLAREYPHLPVIPAVADFTRHFTLPPMPPGRRVVYFSGSTIGNFTPPEARTLLSGIARLVGGPGGLLIGADLQKRRDVLERAYDDARGVTAAFNLNLLARINRELAGDFDLSSFRHRAVYDEHHGRIEMYLVSTRQQTAHVAGHLFHFAEGEAICTEYSYKYTLPGFAAMCRQVGLGVRHVWTDERGLFSVQFADAQAAPVRGGVSTSGSNSQVSVS
jgi:dimethylhistidine N-methyltransferase